MAFYNSFITSGIRDGVVDGAIEKALGRLGNVRIHGAYGHKFYYGVFRTTNPAGLPEVRDEMEDDLAAADVDIPFTITVVGDVSIPTDVLQWHPGLKRFICGTFARR